MKNQLETKSRQPIIFMICGLLPAVLAPIGVVVEYDAPSKMAAFGTIVSALLLVFYLIKNKSMLLPKKGILILMAGIILWSLVSVIWSINNFAVWDGLFPWVSSFVFGILLINSISNLNGVLLVLKTMMLFITGLALIGIGQGLFGLDIIPQLHPPAITFVNRNSAALLMSFAFPIAFILTFSSRKMKDKGVALMCLAIIIGFIWLTETRSAILSLTIQALLCSVWLIWKQKSAWFISFSTISGIVLAISLGFFLLFKVGTLEAPNRDLQTTVEAFEAKYLEYRINSRIPHWVNTLSLVKDKPIFGTGFQNWKIEVIPYLHANLENHEHIDGIELLQLHNDPLQFVAEFGILGLIFMVLIFYYLFIYGRQLLSKRDQNEFELWYFVPFSAIIGIGVGSNLSFPLQLPIHILLFVTMIALIVKISNLNGLDEFANVSFKKFNILMIVVSIVIAGATIKYQTDKLKSDTLSKQAELYMESDPNNAMRKSRLALSKFSSNNHALLMQCFAYMKLGDLDRAEQLTRKFLESEPYSIKALSLLSEIFYNQGKFEESLELISDILDMQPRSVARRRNMAFLLFYKLDRIEEGIDQFKRLLDYDYRERSLFLVGGDLLKRGDTVRYTEIVNYLHERFPENEEYTAAFENLMKE